jgi:hypothetical protein
VIPRPCLGCGEPTAGSRCTTCTATRTANTGRARGTASARGYDSKWARLSLRARRLQPFCSEPGCEFPITATHPLTAHHLVWPATKLEQVEVLCLTHNNRRGMTER